MIAMLNEKCRLLCSVCLCCRLTSPLLAQAWAEVWGTHKVGGSEEGGAAIALNAGIDQEGGGNSAINTLAQGIADGKTTKDEVARALRNLFRLRIRLGLLDPPMSVSYPQSPTAIITFVATSP